MPRLAPSRPTHFMGIGITALLVLAYQVLLTRIFSVMLYYHFAFVGISLAMLGLTIGAQKVYLDKKRFSPERLETEWAKAALGFSMSSALLILLFLYLPLFPPFTKIFSLFMLLFVVPFTYSGICVTLLLTKSGAPVSRLYAADLAGASFGCMGIVGILFFLDPVTITFGLAALAAFSAWLMAHKSAKLLNFSKSLTAFWLLLFVLHGALYETHSPHLGVVWAKGYDLGQVLFERWNAFSLVRVIPGTNIPFGWGFGHRPAPAGPDQLNLNIDAQAGTVITHFDGKNLQPLQYLANDVINAGYHIQPVGNVAVIGVGGGRDILSALYFGAKHIVGLELNPSIFEALTRRFDDFSGHLDRRPEVSLVNAEARSWLNSSQSSFDLIQISLIDTWAATAAGGLTLSENKLYTVNAWNDFMNRLTPGGMLSVSRWFDPLQHKGEFYRLLSIAAETLRQRGIPASAIKQHILAFSVENGNSASGFAAGIVTVIVSPAAFSAKELAKARHLAETEGFHLMAAADTAWDNVSATILAGNADDAFYASLPLDVSAPTDDRPFFFHMERLKDAVLGNGRSVDETKASGDNNAATHIVLALLLGTVLSTLYFTVIPLLDTWRQMRNKSRMVSHLIYFAGIGLGFMLTEISQMQRLMIFLGHPVYGLTVVLFTLLLFGGMGSAMVKFLMEKKSFPLWLWPIVLCVVLGILGMATPFFTEQLKTYGTGVRVIASIALLAPAGFFMGMMFPFGMAASQPFQPLQSWFWSINGATSVLGSVLGVIISMQFGIACALWTGVACYLLCAFLLYRNLKTRSFG